MVGVTQHLVPDFVLADRLPATLIPSGEYTLSYRDNVNAGTAAVIITNANGGNLPDTVMVGLITSFGLMATVTEPAWALSTAWLPSPTTL